MRYRLLAVIAAGLLLGLVYFTAGRGWLGPEGGTALLLVWELRDGQPVTRARTVETAAADFEPPSFSPTSGEFFLPQWASRPWLKQSLLIWRPDDSGPISLRWATPRPWRLVPLVSHDPGGPAMTGVDSEGRVNIVHRGEKAVLSPGADWGAVWTEGSVQKGIRVVHRGLYRVATRAAD